jgi:polyhydroxybutyrate depolymerase
MARWWRRSGTVMLAVAVVALVVGCGTNEPTAQPTGTASTMPSSGTGTVDVDGRPVTVHVPASYEPATPAPLVIALHGYTSNAAELESYLRLTAESDRKGFVYAYPDGSTDQRGARYWDATDACCDFYGSNPDNSRFLSDLITKIEDSYRIDRARVYLIGHSNGAFMAFRMACDHADQITAIVAVNGATWQDASRCRPSEPVSVLAIHSSADETIAFAGGAINGTDYPSADRAVTDWLGYDRCADAGSDGPNLDLVADLPGAETAVRTYASGCAGGTVVHAWTINGGEHVPKLGAGFAPAVTDFMLSRTKPGR